MVAYRRPAPLPDVLEEFVDEAGWLYEMRLRSFEDPELSWEDLSALEDRLDPHLDGLASGGWASAEWLGEVLQDPTADPRESFAAAAVLPRLPFVEPIGWLVDAAAADPERLPAITTGLGLCTAASVGDWALAFFDAGDPALAVAAAQVVGFRREGAFAPRLASLRAHPDPRVATAALSALEELGEAPDPLLLRPLFDALDDPDALGRLVELQLLVDPVFALLQLRRRCETAPAELLASLLPRLAVAGGLEDADRIAAALEREPAAAPAALVALGLSGSLRHVGVLLSALEDVSDPERHQAAVAGLRFVAGVDRLPGFDPEEATPEEVSAFAAGWRAWWSETGSRGDPALPWRRGAPLSPRALHADLVRAGNPQRHLTWLAARIRFGCPCPVQAQQRHAVQRAQLERFHGWSKDAEPGSARSAPRSIPEA